MRYEFYSMNSVRFYSSRRSLQVIGTKSTLFSLFSVTEKKRKSTLVCLLFYALPFLPLAVVCVFSNKLFLILLREFLSILHLTSLFLSFTLFPLFSFYTFRSLLILLLNLIFPTPCFHFNDRRLWPTAFMLFIGSSFQFDKKRGNEDRFKSRAIKYSLPDLCSCSLRLRWK